MKQRKESSRSMYTFIPWPNSTLIILFSEMLKFSKFIFPNQYIYCERKYLIFKNISFVETNVSKLINYLFDGHMFKWPWNYGGNS
jgi:hypothetical protein